MEKVILIDGNNILFRSYYATAYSGNVMRNSKGFPTNALYGFINMINKILVEEKPNYVMIAFDKGKTFRHKKYDFYKEGRSETPDELKQQFPVAKQLVEAMGMTYLEIDNYEADDIIGTFAKKVNEKDNFIGTIISSDKDLLQLITDEVEVKLLKQKDFIRMNLNTFKDTYGIDPIRIIDLKALMGDASDNIPGVKGIGEKTALNLLHEYETLDNVYANLDNIKGKLKEKLENGRESAYISYDLATICQEVPINTDYETVRYKGINPLKYIEMLEELEFYSIIKKLDIPEDLIKEDKKEIRVDFKIISSSDELRKIEIKSDFAIYLEILGSNYHKDKTLGVGIYNKELSIYIPFEILKEYPEFLNNKYKKFTYDLKKLLVPCLYSNITLENITYDLLIACYLLNKNANDDIAYIANNMGYDISFYDNIYGANTKLAEPSTEVIASESIKKAKFIFDTKDEIIKEIRREEADYLFENIEIPLSLVLADMEVTGVNIDRDLLEEMSVYLKKKIDSLSLEIYGMANCEFNISSPKQLGEVLFEQLSIPYPKKKKTGNYSTSKDILDKVKDDYPIIEKVLEYRTLTKLYSNYTIGLINEIANDGKIHTTFTQTLTRTGRLSSISPNLQNIPVRLEEGRLVRKAFVPSKGNVMLSADYSQVELRVFASMSQAGHLIEAFNMGMDIHTQTAMDVFKVDKDSVDRDMRRTAKAVNFGILYGISSFGLSEDLGINVYEAKNFIDTYLATYPGISEYMKKEIEDAKRDGYVKTLMNRKRIIEELNNKNYMIRSQGERIALNTPIQGTAADILKKAMIEIYNKFKELKLKSKMIIQVHDELVFDVFKDELETVRRIVKDIMENTYKLSVPLKVEIEVGNNWYEAK